jgi:hypothetical protein
MFPSRSMATAIRASSRPAAKTQFGFDRQRRTHCPCTAAPEFGERFRMFSDLRAVSSLHYATC